MTGVPGPRVPAQLVAVSAPGRGSVRLLMLGVERTVRERKLRASPAVLPMPPVVKARVTATPTLTVPETWSVAPVTVPRQSQGLPKSQTVV